MQPASRWRLRTGWLRTAIRRRGFETDAVATLEQAEGGFRLTSIRLSVRGEVDGIDEEAFRAAAEEAKEGCPVSNALADSVEITLDAALA